MNTDIVGKCWACAAALTKVDYGRELACLGCDKPTRVCRNCRHYAPGRPDDCMEPLAEPVSDKERANFCELFDPAITPVAASGSPGQADALEQAEDLFK